MAANDDDAEDSVTNEVSIRSILDLARVGDFVSSRESLNFIDELLTVD